MPKIVDREAHSHALAQKAAEVFMEQGFGNVGMRDIAAALGLSKSALYHYFPSKQALFVAASAAATQRSVAPFRPPEEREPSIASRVESILASVRTLDGDFKGEMTLLADYLRPLTQDQIRNDPAMIAANATYLSAIEAIVGSDAAAPVLFACYGFLLQRMFDGGVTPFEDLANSVTRILSNSA
ncbi:helix-turn-helix domain-containing protein [Litorivita sp. NS0012-18]|uniref:TetR/AcrR family transcriptional regulator n=1 Tax=Litorivita sp. NS0012-18 TaxID=3127655 RepID=UPI0031093286